MENKLSLLEVIKKATKRKCSFFELDYHDQIDILDYIQDHNLNIKVFGRKWFDILTNKFYCIELKPREDLSFGIEKVESTFERFDDFFEYVQGDIYENTCLYGFRFDKAAIQKYSIDIKKINFDSFIDETIDSYTYEAIISAKQVDSVANVKRAKRIADWINNHEPIKTLKELEDELKEFTTLFNFLEAKNVFFSMMIRKNASAIKNAIIEYACKNDIYSGVSFEKVLQTYGRDVALTVIDNFDGMCSYHTKKKRIRMFKSILEGYENNSYKLEHTFGFNSDLQMYYVKDRYFHDQYFPLYFSEYFCSFDEFASFVGGDLCGADLSKAPLATKDILKYKIDSKTKRPSAKGYKRYDLIKSYTNDEFIVKQIWSDELDTIVLSKDHSFKRFFDFVHFLKGDLSSADLILCDGIENINKIKDLNLDGIKVRSDIAEKLSLPIKPLPNNRFEIKSFDSINKYEIETVDNLLGNHPEDNDYSGVISYITDIHLLHRFDAYKCKTSEDINYVIRTISKTIGEQATRITLIGGDTSSDFEIFETFIDNLSAYSWKGHYFFTLGNHELWGLNEDNLSTIVSKYKNLLQEKGKGSMHLVQNNLFYADCGWNEITEEELSQISLEDLRKKTRGATIIIFGGIGFAGMNDEFNADNGIYMDVLDRKGEKTESTKFLLLYEKVTASLQDKNLVILTHMPMKDWGGGEMHAKEGVVYINGHSHRNYYYDDGKKRIYADNQVGYKGKRLSLKQVPTNFNYDWFADYKDGIYEIAKEDYEKFYRGVGEALFLNRQYEKLYMLKREKTYMFLMQTPKGSMVILNGGAIKKAGNHSLDYFYENMVKYSKSVSMFLSKYDSFQKQISTEIKRIGGSGLIHGSIVDIDFYNHLYLNPLDGSITPYFAYSMVDKYVYDNLPSLLKQECPKLYENYIKMIGSQNAENSLTIYGKSLPVTNNRYYVADTDMYKISRILKGLQFTTKYNIVRLWNDSIIADASEENGRLIVLGIIDPDSMPKPTVMPKPRTIREPKPKIAKPVITAEEKQAIRNEKYRKNILEKSNNTIDVKKYRGSRDKSDYVCLVCGCEWSMRSDHLIRRNYTCPHCGGYKQREAKENANYGYKTALTSIEKKLIIATTKIEKPGIKTERKNIRNTAMDVLVLSTINENNGLLTKKQLVNAICKGNSLISKNSIVNSLSRIDENEEVLIVGDKISISEKGKKRLQGK